MPCQNSAVKNELSALQLITELVLAHRNRGSFLSHHDYRTLQKWLTHCADVDFLMLLLSDKLPKLFAKNPLSSLTAIDKTVMRSIARHTSRDES